MIFTEQVRGGKTVFISLNFEMITTAFFGADAAISNDFYPQFPNTSEKSFQGGYCHQFCIQMTCTEQGFNI